MFEISRAVRCAHEISEPLQNPILHARKDDILQNPILHAKRRHFGGAVKRRHTQGTQTRRANQITPPKDACHCNSAPKHAPRNTQ